MKLLVTAVFVASVTVACVAEEISIEIQASKERTNRSDFEEDHLDLVLKQGTKVLDKTYLYSSYGKAEAKIIKDSKGQRYAVVRHGEGRGTQARYEFITVYKVVGKIDELAKFPIGGPAGASSDWEYRYKVERPASGGVMFSPSLHLTGNDTTVQPQDRTRLILVK